jgi:hypothetical protein
VLEADNSPMHSVTRTQLNIHCSISQDCHINPRSFAVYTGHLVLAPEGLYFSDIPLTTLQISGAPVMMPQFKYSHVQKAAITATQNALKHKIVQLMSEIE